MKPFVSELVIRLACGKTNLLSAQRKLIDVCAQSRLSKDRSPFFANGFANFIRAVSYFTCYCLLHPPSFCLFVVFGELNFGKTTSKKF